MKKIIIISYFYPPANFVGGDRIASWSKYLHEFGYYPIIVTRQWNDGQKDLTDKLKNNQLEIEYNGTHEVHRLPLKRSLRDRCAKYPSLKLVQKTLTLFELIFSNFFMRTLPYSNLFFHTKNLIAKDPEIGALIASGRPFQSFFIGYKIKKRFPKIKWIPDYRDEWSTHQNKTSLGKFSNFIEKLEKKSEKKWTSNADIFLSVSDYWVKSIQLFIQRTGKVVKNGFEPLATEANNSQSEKLVLGYVGTLYPSQNIELLIKATEQFKDNVKLVFIGIDVIEDQGKRVEELCKTQNVTIYPRMLKDELNKKLSEIDVFFLTSFANVKGWYPVKLFDYYNWNRPILLAPSDNDVMESFIQETNSGYCANDYQNCVELIDTLIKKKKTGALALTKRNEAAALKYTRKYQTEKLAEILNELLHT